MTVGHGSQKAHGDRVAKLSLVVIATRVQVIGRSFKVLEYWIKPCILNPRRKLKICPISLVVIATRVQVIGRSFKVLGNGPRAGKSEIRISSKCL